MGGRVQSQTRGGYRDVLANSREWGVGGSQGFVVGSGVKWVEQAKDATAEE